MSQRVIPVTVVIPVRNEEGNIGRCLERLTDFQEVVVVDSSSTDRTVDIAAAHGASVVNFEWTGEYPKKRNWFLINHALKTDWVLFLDADELIGDAFCDALVAAIQQDGISGYWLKYDIYFLGRRLRYGLPQRKLALFRSGKGLFERIDENRWSTLDMEVHEHPIIDGPVGEIPIRIDHNDDRGMRKFIDRHVEYAQWEAGRLLLLRSQKAAPNSPLTLRQKAKYRFILSWWYPGAYFFYSYGIRLGFLDGWAGFAYAGMKFWYFTLIQTFISDSAQRRT